MTVLDYTRRQTLHRPTDPSAMGAEIRRLHDTKLKAWDIAEALNLPLPLVIEALRSKSLAEVHS